MPPAVRESRDWAWQNLMNPELGACCDGLLGVDDYGANSHRFAMPKEESRRHQARIVARRLNRIRSLIIFIAFIAALVWTALFTFPR